MTDRVDELADGLDIAAAVLRLACLSEMARRATRGLASHHVGAR